MKKIVIIAAMNEEMQEIRNIMKDVSIKKIFDIDVYEGKINGKDCVLALGGVGKVNAARSTQILIDMYEVEFVINVGSARRFR